jgi:hypothetical protein
VPLFMDVHDVTGGVTIDGVARAHLTGLQSRAAREVRDLRY